MSKDLPPTSLLICSRNRPQLLWETVQSILTGGEVPAEMVIVDQSDRSDSRLSNFQAEEDCTIRYVWSERKGVSFGRNMAISNASHSILVFTDDDMRATSTWFGSLVRALLAAGPQAVVTGQVLASKDGSDGFTPSTRDDRQVVIYKGRVDRDVLFTGNMIGFRSTVDSIGGFDTRLGPGTRFPAAEDNDFAFRLLEAGYQIIYEPGAVIYHRAWRSENEFLALHWNYGRGQGAFYSKHFNLRDPHMIRRMARDVSGYVLRFPIRLFRNRVQAYRDMLYVAGMIYGAIQWRIQHRSKSV
jgi:GT2 family glycosyltransferase